ncbi:MAG: hypothetical protein IJF48_01760 [Clostridia bacterium]|nr:hypothetical protein [Clostridia bacterium]
MRDIKNTQTPKAKVLRSAEGDFLGAYPFPDPAEFPSKYPCEDAFLHGSVASATDCTGIAVVQPETDEEAESLMNIKDIPITSVEGDSIIPNENRF